MVKDSVKKTFIEKLPPESTPNFFQALRGSQLEFVMDCNGSYGEILA